MVTIRAKPNQHPYDWSVTLFPLWAEHQCPPSRKEDTSHHFSSQAQEQATCCLCIYQIRNLPSRAVKKLENGGENMWMGLPFEMMIYNAPGVPVTKDSCALQSSPDSVG